LSHYRSFLALIATQQVNQNGKGNFVWNTKGIAPGKYSIYEVTSDASSVPVSSYARGKVQVREATDLAVRQTVCKTTIAAGSPFSYQIVVTNNSSTAVKVVATLPEGATLLSSSLKPISREGNTIKFKRSKNITLNMAAPNGSQTIAGQVAVSSTTYDSKYSNNSAVLSSEVDPSVKPVNLGVTRRNQSKVIRFGKHFTYTLTVKNTDKTASNVTLTESLYSDLTLVSAIASRGTVQTVNGGVVVRAYL
jgi:uncharacterized repeat protein (TIGR01451 family)